MALSRMTIRPSLFGMKRTLISLLALFQLAHCEIRPIDLLLEPVSAYVRFVEGFLLVPGIIDLSGLHFTTATEQYIAANFDDDVTNEITDDQFESGGGGRRLTDNVAGDEDDNSSPGTALDIAVFHSPSKCANTHSGCNWTDLGVGARDDKGQPRYCCSRDTIDKKLCSDDSYGRLILDPVKFNGKHRFVKIPTQGKVDTSLKYSTFEQKKDEENGKYVLVMANCNDEGRPVIVSGKSVWKSRHGYLPGDLFGLMYFYALVTIIYFILLLWYGITMKNFEESNIPIQKWIFGTICMGALELFFRTGDLFVWNEDGTRFWLAFYVGLIVGVLKRGISRCLVVMVSLGWGVVRDDLGSTMTKITFLGGVYILASAIQDIMVVVAYTQVKQRSEEEEDELFDIVRVLAIVVALIDVLFYLWIIDALNGTMEYLESLSQSSKLLRYLRLRCILLFSILFAVIWCIFSLVDSYDEGIVSQESKWVVDASMELNYIFVLVGVAILWRPNPNAKEYAYVMELPATTTDEEGEEGLVEMTGVVPSAADDDEDDGEIGKMSNGDYRDHDKDDS